MLVCAGLVLITGACDRSDARFERRRVEISGAVFRALYDAELGGQPDDAFGVVVMNEQICGVTFSVPGHPANDLVAGRGEGEICQESFSAEEQATLLGALRDLPGVRFTSEPEEVGDRLVDGDLAGIGLLLSLGPIEGTGDRVEVPARSACGGRCGRWMTFVVERGDGGWAVTGTTGPFGMA